MTETHEEWMARMQLLEVRQYRYLHGHWRHHNTVHYMRGLYPDTITKIE
jgi:hypothetical protein